MGGTPLPPLTENHPAQKPSAERGGTLTPPLTEKIRLVVFESFPLVWISYLFLERQLDEMTSYFWSMCWL